MKNPIDYRNAPIPQRVWDRFGELRLVAVIDGYVALRRPAAAPGLMSIKEWIDLDRKRLGPKGSYE